MCPLPKALRKVQFSFEEPHLTHFGGMFLIQRFCQKLGLRRLIQRHLRPGPRFRYKTLKTLRMEMLVLPGRLIKRGSRSGLRLPRGYHFQPEFEQAVAKNDKLKFPKRTFL